LFYSAGHSDWVKDRPTPLMPSAVVGLQNIAAF